jgi:two-component system sensor kinase FixL
MLKTQSRNALSRFDVSALTPSHASSWSRQDWQYAGGFLLGYLLLEWIGARHASALSAAVPWNPQVGLALAFVLVFGLRFLPVFFIGVLCSEISIRHESFPLLYVVMKSVVVCVSYGLAAVILERLLHHAARIRTVSELTWTLAVAVVTPLVVGVLHYGAVANAGLIQLTQIPKLLSLYWIGDALGIIATLPLLLVCGTIRGRRRVWLLLRSWETLLQLAIMLVLLALLFALQDEGPIRYFFIMFMPLLWIAVRHGLLGASIALLIFVLGAIALLELRGSGVDALLEIQMRSLALGITALVLGVVVDERRRAQERLQQSMRLAAAGEMAAALAHELNQPLTALVSYGKACQLLLSHEKSDKQALNQTVDKVSLQAQRIATIVARLRDFLRSGRMSLESVGVAELIASARAHVARENCADTVEIRADIPSGLPSVYVDRTEIEIVLRNLLSNAIESICIANASVRVVRIDVAAAGSNLVRISVIDSGPGVSPEIRDRLFSPFETSKSHGMGMGLAVSRAIVEAHGGQLWAEPVGFGVFHLTLPTTQGDADGDRT